MLPKGAIWLISQETIEVSGQTITGGIVSLTVNSWLHVALLPHKSKIT